MKLDKHSQLKRYYLLYIFLVIFVFIIVLNSFTLAEDGGEPIETIYWDENIDEYTYIIDTNPELLTISDSLSAKLTRLKNVTVNMGTKGKEGPSYFFYLELYNPFPEDREVEIHINLPQDLFKAEHLRMSEEHSVKIMKKIITPEEFYSYVPLEPFPENPFKFKINLSASQSTKFRFAYSFIGLYENWKASILIRDIKEKKLLKTDWDGKGKGYPHSGTVSFVCGTRDSPHATLEQPIIDALEDSTDGPGKTVDYDDWDSDDFHNEVVNFRAVLSKKPNVL